MRDQRKSTTTTTVSRVATADELTGLLTETQQLLDGVQVTLMQLTDLVLGLRADLEDELAVAQLEADIEARQAACQPQLSPHPRFRQRVTPHAE